MLQKSLASNQTTLLSQSQTSPLGRQRAMNQKQTGILERFASDAHERLGVLKGQTANGCWSQDLAHLHTRHLVARMAVAGRSERFMF
jgi:hypothetical protein